jgi:uncharacterized protein YceK
MRYRIAVIAVITGLVVSGCSSGMSDEQFDQMIYEQKLIEYKKCLVEYNGSGDKCRALKP